jgi:hypothetical protein
MSKSFKEFKKSWRYDKVKTLFTSPFSTLNKIRLVNENPHLNKWLLPFIYTVTTMVNLMGTTWYPTVILWSLATILCFVKVWEIVPYIKKAEPKKRMMYLSLFVCLGYGISMLLKIFV